MNDTTGELRTAIEAIKYPVVAGLKHYPEDIPIDVKHMVPVEVVDAILALLAAQRQRWEVAARIDEDVQISRLMPSKDVFNWFIATLLVPHMGKLKAELAALDGERGKEQADA